MAQPSKPQTSPHQDQKARERPDHPRDELLVDETVDDFVPRQRPAGLDERDRQRQAGGIGPEGRRLRVPAAPCDGLGVHDL